MKKVFSLMLVAFMLIGFSACTYEEGPTISLLTKTNRLTNKWKLDKVTENGVDVTSQAQYNQDGYIEFQNDGKMIVNVEGSSFEGTWEFVNDKESIHIVYTMTMTILGVTVTNDVDATYRILKLKSKELWYEDVEDDNDVMVYQCIPY